MENSEKLKISSDLFFIRLLFIGVYFILVYLLGDYKKMETSTLITYIILAVVLLLCLIYLFTRPNIYCDSENLYILPKSKSEVKIPLRNIYAINFSVIGFGLPGFSYKIKYRSDNDSVKSIRLFPSFSSYSVPTLIRYTREQNPYVKIRNWSIGINELFD
jgi:hypothetical protein